MSADPADALRTRNLRVTPQRRAILSAFSELPEEHLSADEVHARAAAQVPEIGRGTVYATLAELTELGLLAAQGAAEPVRYERNTSPHEHFRCRLCLRLYDVELPAPTVSSLERSGFAVESIAVVAEGVCVQCRDYERGLGEGAKAMRDRPQLTRDVVDALSCAVHEADGLGPVALGATDAGIVRVAFEDHADFEQLAARARTRRGPRGARERVNHAIEAVDAYLGGDRGQAGDAMDWPTAGGISPGAMEATREIQYGRHRSYQQLDVDASAYDRGYAMGTNPMPVLLPCHRVRRGAVAPEEYVGGAERRRRLQDLEQDA
jgi:Fur family transcriptional regulator, stress-responsive regulator